MTKPSAIASFVCRRSLLALVILTCLAATADAGRAEEKGGCDRTAISAVVSPNDEWVALVHEDVCNDGYFVTTVTDTVQIARRETVDTVQLRTHPDNPSHENDVFSIDEHGDPKNRPLTQWLSAQRLQITIPNKSLIGLQRSSYEGIEVVIKFEPNDPEERERWLKSLGLPIK